MCGNVNVVSKESREGGVQTLRRHGDLTWFTTKATSTVSPPKAKSEPGTKTLLIIVLLKSPRLSANKG